MRLFVHTILLIFATFNISAFVNAISSSSSDSSSSDSDSSSSSAATSSQSVSSSAGSPHSASLIETQNDLAGTRAQHTSIVPAGEPSLVNFSAAERKRIKNREYMREKRKRLPEREREIRRKYIEAQRKKPEWRAKKSLSDKIYRTKNKEHKKLRDQAYRKRNHETILRKQREARALQKQLSTSSNKKRKSQERTTEPSQKKIRLDSNFNAHSIAQVPSNIPNNQQSQRRNVLRIKLSQETIQKYLSNKKQGSPKE